MESDLIEVELAGLKRENKQLKKEIAQLKDRITALRIVREQLEMRLKGVKDEKDTEDVE